MKRKNMLIIFILVLAAAATQIHAEEAEKKRAGQVTFFYPMGTNGLESLDYSNSFSLNILFGMNGGVDAFEAGGIGNYNAHDVSGIQIAGVSNINMEETRGLQFAGVSNTNFGDSVGLICSGTLNTVFGNSWGVMASTINVTTEEMKGLQIGTLNYAARSKGVQLGVVNVAAEGADSLPIGIINIIKDGYYAIEASAGDTLYSNINYKMGVERFYTIFSVGGSVMDGMTLLEERNWKEQDYIFSYGLGWGSMIPVGNHASLAIEASSHEIVHDWNWDQDVNLLNKIDLNGHFHMGDHLSFFAGPSINVYVTGEELDGEYGTLPVPYTFYEKEFKGVHASMWVGGNAGVTYRF